MLAKTITIPKELLSVYDRPFIEHVVKDAIAVVIIEVIRVTRGGKEAIENHTNIGAVSRSVKFLDYHGSSLRELVV